MYSVAVLSLFFIILLIVSVLDLAFTKETGCHELAFAFSVAYKELAGYLIINQGCHDSIQFFVESQEASSLFPKVILDVLNCL